jgi:hypothetical protein
MDLHMFRKTPKVLSEQQNHVQELLLSTGWKIINQKLLLRREAAVRALLSQRDIEQIVRAQIQVGEVESLLRLPYEILNEKPK